MATSLREQYPKNCRVRMTDYGEQMLYANGKRKSQLKEGKVVGYSRCGNYITVSIADLKMPQTHHPSFWKRID